MYVACDARLMSEVSGGSLDVLDDFEGSSIGRWGWDGDVLNVGLREEPLVRVDGAAHDYSLHFVFGLRNRSESEVSVVASVDWEKPGEKTAIPGRLYRSHSPDEEFRESPVPIRADGRKRFEWTVTVGPGESVYWSNTLWRPFALLNSLFPEMAKRAGLTAYQYGRSIEGRELVAYWKPDAPRGPVRPVVLVTCGFHPVEGDTLGAEAIFEWLCGDGQPALDHLNLVVVPVANPDGFAHGHNGCNAAGVNFFWDFRRDDAETCPEAYYLWELVRKVSPVVYLDFHSYSVHGPAKRAGPYTKSERLYTGSAAKSLAGQLTGALSALANTRPQLMFGPSTLAFQITREMNTITFAKYHLHQDHGRDGMKALAVDVVKRVVDVLAEEEVSASELLTRPYGSVRKGVYGRIEQFAYRSRYSYSRGARAKLGGLLKTRT